MVGDSVSAQPRHIPKVIFHAWIYDAGICFLTLQKMIVGAYSGSGFVQAPHLNMWKV